MDLNEVRSKMAGAIEHLKGELAQIRTGRANANLVSDIVVDAYDSKMTIKELAQITIPEPTVIVISPWDKSIITNIVSAIARSNIGLNGVVDGDVVRIVIPPLTTERKEQFIKQMHQTLELFRVQIRQVRHEFVEKIKSMKESGDLSEDDSTRQQEEVQKLHNEFIEAIEVLGKAKEEALREV